MMTRSADKDASPQSEPDARVSARDDAARDRKRERDRRYRLAHPEEHAAQRRRWVEANRERIRASNRRWRDEHLEHARKQNRESMRRSTARKRRDAESRAKTKERARRWREKHPDRIRAYQRDWAAANRDKVREYASRYYDTHRDEVNAKMTARRDADPVGTKARNQAWAAAHKERRAELQRARRANPEIYAAELEASAAARRLKRALARAGLPPKSVHPATAAERRANERAADAYFADPALPEHVRQVSVFVESLTGHMLKHHARMREFAESYVATRERMGLPDAQADDVTWARAVEVVLDQGPRVELLTSRDVAAAVRSAKVALRQLERKQQYDQLVRAVTMLVKRDRSRLAADAAIESHARRRRGRPPLTRDELLIRIALQEVVDRTPTNLLSAGDVRKLLDRGSTEIRGILESELSLASARQLRVETIIAPPGLTG
ncbi:hypothetical protein MUN74_18430 [Agromyces endophyticus]|uniref:hypothetical protein n=1 Tax=Agromyces sp. H17E-10 TaxID=2932244 RepID=UPI001FCFC2ED|nr:hypothetical protein [Agromyces sp. H17E-10]UOQ89209.1 hypothetical protein MUN74_18430 [Agromyces sp. H17E-10]